MTRTWGPIVHKRDEDVTFTASCARRPYFCTNLANRSCHFVKPPRTVDDSSVTPEWCPMRDSALSDAQEADDFHRMGLDRMSRQELLTICRTIPEEMRPKPLTKATVRQLCLAIRQAKQRQWPDEIRVQEFPQ